MSEKKSKNFISKEHRGGGLISMADDVSKITKKLFGDKGTAEIEILSNWASIAGEELAAATQPLRIDFKPQARSDGILHLACENGAYALEIGHKTPYLIDKINTFFGYRAVSQIKIHQGFSLSSEERALNAIHNHEKKLVTPEEETYIKEIVSGVQNPDLKARLESLGRKVFEKNK